MKYPTKEYNLETLFPDIIKEWYHQKNDKKPSEYTPFTPQKVWWICPKGDDHIWKTNIYSRTKFGRGCPVCINQKIVKSNCLSTLRPNLLKELHPTKNANFDPTRVGIGSKVKVWWICNRGHSWETRIYLRAKRKTGCPFCKNVQTSSMEIRLLSELSYFFKDVKHRHKVKGVECDLFISRLKLGIEYDGKYWHKGRFKKDKEKSDFFQSNGYLIIRVRERGLKKISKNDVIHDIQKNDIVVVCDLFQRIVDFGIVGVGKKKELNRYIRDKILLNNDYYKELQDKLPKPILGKSFEELQPTLSKDWHPTKNGNLLPSDITENSGKKVWWLCEEGHAYKSRIDHRTNGVGCPYCYGRLPTRGKNLSTEYPEVAVEFHPTKNGDILPTQVSPHSGKKYWWKCSKVDDHEWETAVDSRTGNNKSGCPFCWKENRTPPARVSKNYNLGVLYPQLSKEWDKKKNSDILPTQVSPHSGKKYWWKCPSNHSYKAVVSNRTKGSDCPKCYRLKKRFLQKKNFNNSGSVNRTTDKQYWSFRIYWEDKRHSIHLGTDKKLRVLFKQQKEYRNFKEFLKNMGREKIKKRLKIN